MAASGEESMTAQEPTMAYPRMVDVSVKVPYVEGINLAEVEHRLAAYAQVILLMPEKGTPRTQDGKRQNMTLEEAENYLDSLVQGEHHFVPSDLNGMRDMPNREYM